MIWLGFLLLTSLSRNHIFSEHSWSLPRDFQAWCPCGWSWSCGGTWRPGGSGRGTPWCGLRWDAEATRWSCEGHSALARLWGRFLGKSRCVEAENETQIRYLTHGISFMIPRIVNIPASMFICSGTGGSKSFVCSSVMFVIFSSIRFSYETNKRIHVLLICSNSSSKEFKNLFGDDCYQTRERLFLVSCFNHSQ